jgi:hypothetical protein
MVLARGAPRIVGLLLIFLLVATTAFAGNFTPRETLPGPVQPPMPLLKAPDAHTYSGYLRIFMVEPQSRYKDIGGVPYDFGFLAFAKNQAFTLEYGDTISQTVDWNGSTFVINDLNIMAIAVVYNGEGHQSYNEGHDGPFTAYYVDAAAGALSGQTAVDDVSGTYTHTVFVEEVSSTT